MSSSPSPADDLALISRIELDSRRHYALPRWYAVFSTALFLLGLGIFSAGLEVGWFAPLLGVTALTVNVLLFPVLLVSWRARGVVPRSGKLASSPYWRIAPILVPVGLILGFVTFALWPEQQIWLWCAVAVPFGIEQAIRLSAWARR